MWTAPAPPQLWRVVREWFKPPWNIAKHEAWTEDELRADVRVRAWVCNPSAAFTITDKTLLLFPNLSLLVTPSTGTNHIDRAAVEAKGVTVKCLLDNRAELETISASAEFTFLLLLAAMRRLPEGMAMARSGAWHDDNAVRGNELQGKNVGLVGYGRIGRRMHRWLNAFGANVAWYDPYVSKEIVPLHNYLQSYDPDICWYDPIITKANRSGETSLDFLFDACNAVVICCAYTPETHGMITGAHLLRMQKNGVVVNTSRGEVMDERSVLDALDKRADLRVAVDVLPGEVRGKQNTKAWIDAGVLVTPHMAGTTIESQTKAARIALQFVGEHDYR